MGSLAATLGQLQRAIVQSPNVGNRTPLIEFGEWRPDMPSLGNTCLKAENVIADVSGYRPFPSATEVSQNALTARCQGAAGIRADSNEIYIYAGDATKLYRMDNSLSFTDVSNGTYSISADDQWEFTRWGGKVIATNVSDAVQVATIGSGNFANMITSTEKPKAKHIAVINNFVHLGDIVSTADGTVRNRQHWSGINDETDYDPAAATQCDYQDHADGGGVAKLIGGENYGLTFQQDQIRRCSYVGGRRVFRFDVVDKDRGTNVPHSVVALGRRVYFWSEEGIFVNDGQESYRVGSERVDRWLLDQFTAEDAPRVSTAVDRKNKIIAWAFPGDSNTSDANFILLYNESAQRFSYVDLDLQVLVPSLTQTGYTLDTLDNIGTDIDDTTLFPYSFDSDTYKGGGARFGSFGTDNKLDHYTGANLAAQIDTGDFQPTPGRSEVTGLSPIVEGASEAAISTPPTMKIASRERAADAVTFGSAVSQNTFGKCPFVSPGKYHRARLDIAAGESWDHAQGVQIDATDLGNP